MKLLNDFFTIIDCKESSGGGFICRVKLNPAHFIYEAHFPKNPVTPGVCIMQIAEEILEQHEGCSLELATVNNIKYMAVISPGENPEVEYSFAPVAKSGSECKAKVTVGNDSGLFAKMSVTYRI